MVGFDAESLQQDLKNRRFDHVIHICEDTLTAPGASAHERKIAMHLKGMAHYFKNELGPSIQCFKTVLDEDPKFTDSAITLSIIYNDIGRYDEAKKIYQVANQSLALKRQGDDDLLDRKFALKHIEIGDLYFKYHRYDEALDDYSKAVRLDPLQLENRIKIAKVYAKKGYTTRAIQEIQQICAEHPDFVPARIHLGLMYYSLGNVIDAQMEWDRALELDPGNAEIRTYRDMARNAKETNV